MLRVQVKYGAHISIITGKFTEIVEFQGERVRELILHLDKKYPGLKEIFITPTGKLTISTYIYLRRVGEQTRFVVDLDEKLKDDDVITLW